MAPVPVLQKRGTGVAAVDVHDAASVERCDDLQTVIERLQLSGGDWRELQARGSAATSVLRGRIQLKPRRENLAIKHKRIGTGAPILHAIDRETAEKVELKVLKTQEGIWLVVDQCCDFSQSSTVDDPHFPASSRRFL